MHLPYNELKRITIYASVKRAVAHFAFDADRLTVG
jgi:hypothetical protein